MSRPAPFRSAFLFVCLATLALPAVLGDAGPAGAAEAPVPEPADGIGPGSRLVIAMPGGTFGCTASFVFTDGVRFYLGTAGHCLLPAGKTATHGPGADYNPASTTVWACIASCDFGGETGFFVTGTLVSLGPVAYARSTQSGVDLGNDFGLVTIPASLLPGTRTEVPTCGGPTGVESLEFGEPVCYYGTGPAFGETFLTMGRSGVGSGSNANWFWFYGPSAGDSGAPVVVSSADGTGIHGRGAVGTVTHIQAGAAGNVVGTTIDRSVALAAQAGLSISVVLGS